MEAKVIDGINLIPTHDLISTDGVETHPKMAALFAKSCKQAIELLGYDNMQTVRVSCTPMGMGIAMVGGNYIDITHSPRVFKAIKEELEQRMQQWLEIAATQE